MPDPAAPVQENPGGRDTSGARESSGVYIKSQEAHHRKMTFQEEFLALLRKHRIAFDERYLWE